MKNLFKFMIAFILTVCMMFSSWLPNSSHDLKVYAHSNSSSLEVNQIYIIEHTISRQAKNIKLGDAFTTPEFTQYNVETKIGEDFEKDMDGLLDAVYNADIFDNKNIFMREGWRYELDSLEGELKINGIVYNEMSGNNSRFSILGDTINRSLFPDLCYSFNAGGDPKET